MIDSLDVQVDSVIVGLVAGEGFCRGKAHKNRGGVLHICRILGPNGACWVVHGRVVWGGAD